MNPKAHGALMFCALVLVTAPGCDSAGSVEPGGTAGSDTVRVPLSDLAGTYLGFPGRLYPGGNAMPAAHAAIGMARAKNIRPLNSAGTPSASGKYVLLSIGISNAAQEFCGGDFTVSCSNETFMGQVARDAEVNKSTLVVVNGAQGGRVASEWTSPTDPGFDVVRDERLPKLAVTERQVQIVWLKVADPQPSISLPDANADAYALERYLASIARALKVRYQNLQQVFISSRTYAGYATSTLNPEPYAYETGFSVKWLIQAQIDQMEGGAAVDARAGDLNYNTIAPWLAWSAYLWTAGLAGRSDGLIWQPADVGADGTHPSASGRQKVGTLLLGFFKTSPMTRCWFVAGQTC